MKRAPVLIVALLVIVAASACSTARTSSTSSNRPLVMTAGGGSSFNPNFNILSPNSSSRAPGGVLIYEPLLGVNRKDPSKYIPWLATSDSFSDGGTTLTFHLRQGVKFSDRTALTSEDVKYSLELYKKVRGAPYSSVSTRGTNTVVVTYPTAGYGDLAAFGSNSRRLILPEHIWSNQDIKTWTNPNPVGTGPFTVSKFTPQAIFFKMRSDYWGGKGKGLKNVEIIASTDENAVVSMLNQNSLDWSTWGLPDANQVFVNNNPAHHHYYFFSTGSTEGPVFNTTVAPYNDVHVRLALRDAIDGAQIAKVVGIGWPTGSATGLDPGIWGNQIPSPYNKRETQQAAQAKAELAAGGWTVSNGDLVKNGQSYALTYDCYNGYAEWVTTARLMAAQWQQVLGLNVSITELGDDPYSTVDGNGTFGMISETGTWGGNSPYQDYVQYTPDYYTPIGQSASGNTGRWQDPKFQSLMSEYLATAPTDTSKLRRLGDELQTEVAEQAPFIPVAVSGWKAELNTTHWTGFPTPKTATYVPNGTLAPDAIETLMNVSPASSAS